MFPNLTSLTNANLTDFMVRFALALAVGALLGSERERSTQDKTAPGIRTFTLLSLLGAASVVFSPIALAAVIPTAAFVAISPALRRSRKKDDRPGWGATTIAAAALAPVLGALAMFLPALAAATAVAIVITLTSKERIHKFVQQTVTPTELSDAFKFFVVALIALPLLPDVTFGPFNVINPHKIGFLVTVLTGVGWVGYIAVRAFGASRGLPLAGLAGGLVSSTATTAAMVRKAREISIRRPAIAAALLSKVSSLVTLSVLVGLISADVLKYMALPVIIMIVVLLITSRRYAAMKDPGEQPESTDPAADLDLGRPFTLKPALILAGIITAALLLSKAAATLIGSSAVVAVTALTGTADTQAAAIATADLASAGSIDAKLAMIAIVAGLVTNTILKIVLAYTAGGKATGGLILRTLVPATIAMMAGAAASVLFL